VTLQIQLMPFLHCFFGVPNNSSQNFVGDLFSGEDKGFLFFSFLPYKTHLHCKPKELIFNQFNF
jgi:hypothetical protein